MQLIQEYDCDAETAYYYFAVWGTGLTLGNCLSSCLLKSGRKAIFASFVILSLSLVLIGPSSILPLSWIPEKVIFGALGVGLFAMGLSSAFL